MLVVAGDSKPPSCLLRQVHVIAYNTRLSMLALLLWRGAQGGYAENSEATPFV